MGSGENTGENTGFNTGTSNRLLPPTNGGGDEPTGTIFNELWDTADMSNSNSDGFSWAGNNRTSVVTSNNPGGASGTNNGGWCDTPAGTPVAVYNNAQICNIPNPLPPAPWTARTGEYSLRFRYPIGYQETQAEQRYNMGAPYRDLWVSFWCYMPTTINFPLSSSTPGSENAKLMSIYMDDYSSAGDGPTIIWGPWPDENNGTVIRGGYSVGGNTSTGSQFPSTQWCSKAQLGQWMKNVFHVVAATGPGTNDGVMSMWSKFDGDSSYRHHGTLTNCDIASPSGGPDGWQRGYIFGTANAGWSNTDDVEILVDEFRLSETDLR